MIVFTSYLTALYKPLRNIAKITTRVTKATACAERVFDVLHIDERIKDRRDAQPAGRFQGRVSFKHVSFSYQKDGAKILNDVSFTARPGQTLAIVGPNGAGKSTLCAMLPRLFDPDDGTITIDGEKIRHLQLDSLREQIGVVLQQPMLFAGHDRARTSLTESPMLTGRDRRGRAGRRRPRLHRGAAATATKPRSASAATRFRAASGRRSRSRARC